MGVNSHLGVEFPTGKNSYRKDTGEALQWDFITGEIILSIYARTWSICVWNSSAEVVKFWSVPEHWGLTLKRAEDYSVEFIPENRAVVNAWSYAAGLRFLQERSPRVVRWKTCIRAHCLIVHSTVQLSSPSPQEYCKVYDIFRGFAKSFTVENRALQESHKKEMADRQWL